MKLKYDDNLDFYRATVTVEGRGLDAAGQVLARKDTLVAATQVKVTRKEEGPATRRGSLDFRTSPVARSRWRPIPPASRNPPGGPPGTGTSGSASIANRDGPLIGRARLAGNGGGDAVFKVCVRPSSCADGVAWRDEDGDTPFAGHGAAPPRHLSLHVGRYVPLHSHRSECWATCRIVEEGLRRAIEICDAYNYVTAQFHCAWALHPGERSGRGHFRCQTERGRQ